MHGEVVKPSGERGVIQWRTERRVLVRVKSQESPGKKMRTGKARSEQSPFNVKRKNPEKARGNEKRSEGDEWEQHKKTGKRRNHKRAFAGFNRKQETKRTRD